jgi:hypothetical protein
MEDFKIMGVSTDAYLFWGFSGDDYTCWANIGLSYDDPAYAPEGDEADALDDWEEIYAERKGVLLPTMPFSKEPEVEKVYHAFWDAKHRLIKECGCKIDYHCHSNYGIPFVAISDSITCACRGEPKEIILLEIKPEWEMKLREFCDVMGIQWQEPKWWLASYWGQ